MPQKGKVIAVYTSFSEYRRIKAEADSKKWKVGPTVLEIVRMYFAKKDADAAQS
jgi:hypothetical protein